MFLHDDLSKAVILDHVVWDPLYESMGSVSCMATASGPLFGIPDMDQTMPETIDGKDRKNRPSMHQNPTCFKNMFVQIFWVSLKRKGLCRLRTFQPSHFPIAELVGEGDLKDLFFDLQKWSHGDRDLREDHHQVPRRETGRLFLCSSILLKKKEPDFLWELVKQRISDGHSDAHSLSFFPPQTVPGGKKVSTTEGWVPCWPWALERPGPTSLVPRQEIDGWNIDTFVSFLEINTGFSRPKRAMVGARTPLAGDFVTIDMIDLDSKEKGGGNMV